MSKKKAKPDPALFTEPKPTAYGPDAAAEPVPLAAPVAAAEPVA
jgi:hypothetical protein